LPPVASPPARPCARQNRPPPSSACSIPRSPTTS